MKNRIAFFSIFLLAGLVTVPAQAGWVDLTHPFDGQTIYWPTAKSFTLEVVHKGPTEGGWWYESNNYSASEHGGTHIDSPAHFAEGKWTVDQIPLDRLVGQAVVMDLSQKIKKPDYQVSKKDITSWEKENGKIEAGTMLFVYTGWSKRWPDKKQYLGTDQAGDVKNLHFPGFSDKAAELLVARQVIAVGLDTPSLDQGQSKDFKSHVIFGSANVLGFENLNNLDQLPARGAKVYALPMKIGGGSGAPLRIVAEIP